MPALQRQKACSRLLNEASFELTEHVSMQSALPAERDEISFEREVNPAIPLAWLVTKLNGCVPQTDYCFKAFYDQQTVEEPILKLLWGFV